MLKKKCEKKPLDHLAIHPRFFRTSFDSITREPLLHRYVLRYIEIMTVIRIGFSSNIEMLIENAQSTG